MRPVWDDASIADCTTESLLAALGWIRRNCYLSDRAQLARVGSTVTKLVDHEAAETHLHGRWTPGTNGAENGRLAPNPQSVAYCGLVGRDILQRGLLAGKIGEYLLDEYCQRYEPSRDEIHFLQGAWEISLAAEAHTRFLAKIPNEKLRTRTLQMLDMAISPDTLAEQNKVVAELAPVMPAPTPDASSSRPLGIRLAGYCLSARMLRYFQFATHDDPKSGLKSPLDNVTTKKLEASARIAGPAEIAALAAGVCIAGNLTYEDFDSKCENTAAVLEAAAGYIRHADAFLPRLVVTGMRTILQSLASVHRVNGEVPAAARIAQFFRITHPRFVSWKLHNGDRRGFHVSLKGANHAVSL